MYKRKHININHFPNRFSTFFPLSTFFYNVSIFASVPSWILSKRGPYMTSGKEKARIKVEQWRQKYYDLKRKGAISSSQSVTKGSSQGSLAILGHRKVLPRTGFCASFLKMTWWYSLSGGYLVEEVGRDELEDGVPQKLQSLIRSQGQVIVT